MEINENIAGLGKNHDENAREHDIAKKQSEAKPAAENLDMEPHSVSKEELEKKENKPDEPNVDDVHLDAIDYAKKEHDKADSWENTNETGPDRPQF